MGARGTASRLQTLRGSAAFERLLRTRPRMISAHFAVHHVAAVKAVAQEPAGRPVVRELSTDGCSNLVPFVDDSFPQRPATAPIALGLVVPKRHARRAVTRSLLKREMRAGFAQRVLRLEPGDWVLRLRAGFDPGTFTSAASLALRAVVRAELTQVLDRCLAAPARAGAL